MVRGKGAGRGARCAPKAFRISTAVGPRPPFRCSKPQVKISYLGGRRSSHDATAREESGDATEPARSRRVAAAAPALGLGHLSPA